MNIRSALQGVGARRTGCSFAHLCRVREAENCVGREKSHSKRGIFVRSNTESESAEGKGADTQCAVQPGSGGKVAARKKSPGFGRLDKRAAPHLGPPHPAVSGQYVRNIRQGSWTFPHLHIMLASVRSLSSSKLVRYRRTR